MSPCRCQAIFDLGSSVDTPAMAWQCRHGSFGALLLPGPAARVRRPGSAEGTSGHHSVPPGRAVALRELRSQALRSAPAEVRGEFRPIATSVPGIHFSEHLPLLAQRLHRFSIVRSAHHPTPDHIQAIHITLCGCELPGANIDSRNHNLSPAMGAVVAKLRGPHQAGLPGYVTIPACAIRLGRRLHYGDAGYLGPAFSPLDSGMLPVRADAPYSLPENLGLHPSLTVDRLRERVELLEGFTGRGNDEHVRLPRWHQPADPGAVARAFDLNRESVAHARAATAITAWDRKPSSRAAWPSRECPSRL